MPLRPRELAGTIYEALENGPDTVRFDRLGTPAQLCAGEPISQLRRVNGA